MKTLKIIQTILNSYKSRSWNVLIVFIISYIIMGFVVIFIVGAFHPYVSTRGSTDLLECRYTVSLNTAQPYEYFERFMRMTRSVITGILKCRRGAKTTNLF